MQKAPLTNVSLRVQKLHVCMLSMSRFISKELMEIESKIDLETNLISYSILDTKSPISKKLLHYESNILKEVSANTSLKSPPNKVAKNLRNENKVNCFLHSHNTKHRVL